MAPELKHFVEFAAKRIWARYVVGLWSLVGALATVGPQLLPSEWEEKWPNLFAVVVSINQNVPLWAWGMVGLALLLAISIEYGVLQRRQLPTDSDPEIIQLRSDVKRLVHILTGYGSPEHERDTILDLRERIEKSDHAIWLGSDKLYQARVDFLHWSGVAYTLRERHGVMFRSNMERAETMLCLKDAAKRLEAGLTGQPIPAVMFPPPMEP